MHRNKLPKVLVIGINAWREDGTAHTLMDIFRCWDADRLALIYTRADLPNTNVCSRFFQVSESQIIKNLIRPWKTVGKTVEPPLDDNQEEVQIEHSRYAKGHKRQSSLLPLMREIVWKLGRWKSNDLKKFVTEFNPDIIFVPIYPTVYMGRIQKYITKLIKKPTVCYLADDNYSYDSCRDIFSYIHRFWLRKYVGPLACNSKRMFVIVDKEKEDTDRRFGTDSIILTKGIDFSNKKYEHRNASLPLKFVYTGSLLIGRDKTMALLADSINELNKDGVRAELYIYSQTDPTEQILEKINSRASHFCGKISREEVLEVQRNADVVVFAEALDGKEANVAKLSFSTKITDYLSNGKCILAIGKDYIAPIDYFNRYDAAIIAHSKAEIYEAVSKLIDNPKLVDKYGEKAFNTAKKNHDKTVLNQRFIQTMISTLD